MSESVVLRLPSLCGQMGGGGANSTDKRTGLTFWTVAVTPVPIHASVVLFIYLTYLKDSVVHISLTLNPIKPKLIKS